MQHLKKSFSVLLVAVLAIAALPVTRAFADVDTTGPITSGVALDVASPAVGDTVNVSANVDDTTTGGSTIASAEFSVNGGAWTAMTAVDGAFDGVMEDVTGSFTVDTQGANAVCVHGTDSLGNVGADSCFDFNTASLYTFTGFLRPINMVDGTHARAGRNVPVKFKLNLASDGTGVGDPSVFLGLFSYQVDCTTLTGDPSTAVQAFGPGKAAPRYQGNGRWRAHWKTLREYGGTCRLLYASFSDGSTSPTALFIFR